jgi:hypothetical protein
VNRPFPAEFKYASARIDLAELPVHRNKTLNVIGAFGASAAGGSSSLSLYGAQAGIGATQDGLRPLPRTLKQAMHILRTLAPRCRLQCLDGFQVKAHTGSLTGPQQDVLAFSATFERASSPYIGTESSVWNDSQATPCGSIVQYLSLFA